TLRLRGGYRVLEQLPDGRMIAVGEEAVPERLLVLRVLRNLDAVAQADARALTRIEHPGIVPVQDVIRDGNDLVCVMPFLEACDGRQLLARCAEVGRPLPVDVVGWIVQEVARALAALHGASRVHGTIG